MPRVAFQGEQGAYSEDALTAYFERSGQPAEPLPCRTFAAAVAAVDSGDADVAFLPIENTLEGTVAESLTAILESDLFIVGEVRYKIVHCLIGHPGATLEDIRTVYSHPQAIRQCRDFIVAHNLEPHLAYDTAGSVREVKERGELAEAAIASNRAAQVHGMDVLRAGIQSRETNFTRFLVLSKQERQPAEGDRDRRILTTILFSTRHRPGALHECLGEFARFGINLSKLESRPRDGKPWAYDFLVDLEGRRQDADVSAALSGILARSNGLRVLGSYPAWEAEPASSAPRVQA